MEINDAYGKNQEVSGVLMLSLSSFIEDVEMLETEDRERSLVLRQEPSR